METSIFGFFNKKLLKVFNTKDAGLYSFLLLDLLHKNFSSLHLCTRKDLIETITHSKLASEKTSFDANQVYYKLIETDWIIETTVNDNQVCDIDPDGKAFLIQMNTLSTRKSKRLGTEVVKILGLLEIALTNPSERSEAIYAAHDLSVEFSEHVRNLHTSLSSIEQNLKSILDYDLMLEAFFDNYVEKFLIKDYKSLNTTSNPYRHRNKIKNAISQLLDDSMLTILADSASKYHTVEVNAAKLEITHNLHQIEAIFFSLDEYLNVIEEKNKIIEKRIKNIIRFKNNTTSSGKLKKITNLFKRMQNSNNDIDYPMSITKLSLPINESFLFSEPKPKSVIKPNQIKENKRSSKDIELEKAVQNYNALKSASQEKIYTYLFSQLSDKKSIKSEELIINNLEEFFIFTKISSLSYIQSDNNQSLSIFMRDATTENEWLKCKSFTVNKVN